MLLCVGVSVTGARPTQAATPILSPVEHIHVGDLTVGYRTGGIGYPVVLVMGRGGTMAEWDPQLLAPLLRTHHVVVFDNRGMATTNNPSTATLSVSQMASDTVNLMRALGIHRADLLGWSMGGYIAQTVALRHPGLVRRLVLAATASGGTHEIPPAPDVAAALRNPHLSAAHLFSLCFPPDRAGIAGAVSYMRRILLQPDLVHTSFTVTTRAKVNQQAATAQWKSASGGDFDRLSTMSQRTLVADGRDDQVVPIANAYLLAHGIPNARLLVYRNAGHAFLFQDSMQFGKVLTRFLR